MKSPSELLDMASARNDGASDYRLAQLLGVKASAVYNYRSGYAMPANPVMARLATLAGVDPDAAVCWVNIQRSRTDDERETWIRLLSRVQRTKPARLAA